MIGFCDMLFPPYVYNAVVESVSSLMLLKSNCFDLEQNKILAVKNMSKHSMS